MTQPQLEHLTFTPIIEVRPEEVPEMLGKLASGEVLAFVTQTGEPDATYLPEYHREFSALGFNVRESTQRTNDNLGWHDDGPPTPHIPVHMIHDHFTLSGASRVEMVAQPHSAETMEERIAAVNNLEGGLVDLRYFAAQGVAADLSRGHRLFFAARGEQRLKHRFLTTQSPRRTVIRSLGKGYC